MPQYHISGQVRILDGFLSMKVAVLFVTKSPFGVDMLCSNSTDFPSVSFPVYLWILFMLMLWKFPIPTVRWQALKKLLLLHLR